MARTRSAVGGTPVSPELGKLLLIPPVILMHTPTHEVLGQRVTMLNFRRLLRRSYSLWELGSGTSSYPCYRYSPSWHPQSFITLLRGWRPKTGPGWVTLFPVSRAGG